MTPGAVSPARPGPVQAALDRLGAMNPAQRLRLLSGLTMFTFVVTHLTNHALGLISLDAMLAGQRVFFTVWHGLPGTALLAAAFCTHLTLVLYKQVTRRTLRMPWVEALRILLGIVTLCALSFHATGMLVARIGNGAPVRYPDFLVLFRADTAPIWNQLILVTAAWTHGCIGVHLWLRLRAGYRRRFPLITALAVLLPALALLGVLSGAREANERLAAAGQSGGAYGAGSGASSGSSAGSDYGAPSAGSDYGSDYGAPSAGSDYGSDYGGGASAPSTKILGAPRLSFQALGWAVAFLALMILLRLGMQAWERRQGQVTVRYPGGRQVKAVQGASVLDISRMGDIPHAAVCGGRGRCSTCRVHVDAGWEALPPPLEAEARVLHRIKAPPRVRLACQLCPVTDVAVTPLVPANARARDALPYDRMLFGMEQEIVILFSDLRGFTKLSETKLPYDVVHILNQYFAEMGEAIESAGGYLDKFIGDGIMALFGIRAGVRAGAQHALTAARAMGRRLEDLNARLQLDLAQPLRLGIGIHVGHVIVGEMGYKRATSLTAIGDSVNVASRLESATKAAACQLLISSDVADRGGIDLSAFERRNIQVPGRVEGLDVYVIPQATDLPPPQGEAPLPGGGVVGGPARTT